MLEQPAGDPSQPDRSDDREGRNRARSVVPRLIVRVWGQPSHVKRHRGETADGECQPVGGSDQQRPDPSLRDYEPQEAPGEAFPERLAGDVLLLGRMERHHPAGMVDVPRAGAAATRDGLRERIPRDAGV